MVTVSESPPTRENRENGPKKYLSEKRQGIWVFWFAQVVNSFILKIQDIVIFAAKFSNFSMPALLMKLSQISQICTGKFPV